MQAHEDAPIEPEALGCAMIWNHRPTLSFTKSLFTGKEYRGYVTTSVPNRDQSMYELLR